MKIEGFQLQRLTLTFVAPLRTASAEFRVREGARVMLSCQGYAGQGEAMPLPSFGTEPLEACLRALEQASEALKGREVPEDPAAIDALLDRVEPLQRAPAARHALESALLDVLSQQRGVPLRMLLSAQARNRIEVNALLSPVAADALAVEAQRAVASGFRVLKVKVAAESIDVDLERLRAIRNAVGDRPRLRLDANGGWTEDAARGHLSRLCEYGVELCEQPVPAHAVDALRALRGQVPCQIAADEAVGTAEHARTLLQSADVLVLRPMVLGGLWRTLELARSAQETGVGAYLASSLDGVVARAAAAQVAAALPAQDWAHGLATGAHFEEERSLTAYAPREGALLLPDVPGLGLEGRVP